MSPEDIIAWRNLAIVPCIVAVGWMLSIVLCREWVKSDIIRRGCRPLHVRWKLFSWWPVWGPAYQVQYADIDGAIHQALCGVCAWHRPVRWRHDRIVAVASPRWSQRRLPIDYMDGLSYTIIVEPAEPLARRRGSALDR
jgi:hypothetical protein